MKANVLAATLLALVGGAALAQAPPSHIAAAVGDPARPAAQRASDAARKPAETMAFAGVAPGMRVAEIFPGEGYYTRLLARAVGPTGRVYVIPWSEPNTGGSRQLAQSPVYGNITGFFENLLAFRPSPPVDMVWTTQNYHDIATPQRAQVNQVLFRALKPGGTYFILDHAAVDGSGYASLPLHRIDVALLKKEVTAAGFVLVAESNLLRNPADSRLTSAFAPSIRGRTDQFLLKFVKPAG